MATATTAKEESLLEAVASAVASAEDPVDDADNSNDIESQTNTPAIEDQKDKEEGWIQVGSVATNLQTTQDDTTTEDPTTSTILKDNPYKTLASTASSATNDNKPTTTESTKTSNIGILSSEEDDTASVFSFDSYEQRPSIPLRVQNMIQRSMNNNNDGSTNIPGNSSTVPFPSVIGSTTYNDGDVVNVCPCRCLFFTLKETICLIMSALGCAVFLAGLVLLCMYLEGSIF